jgi:hypothetical protein
VGSSGQVEVRGALETIQGHMSTLPNKPTVTAHRFNESFWYQI